MGPAEAEAEAEPPLPLVQAAGEAEAHAAVAATARAAARAGIRGVLMMGLWGFAARAFLAVPRRRVAVSFLALVAERAIRSWRSTHVTLHAYAYLVY